MKKRIERLLQGRGRRWGLFAVLLVALGASLGSTSEKQYQAGGAGIGSGDGGT